MTARSKAEPKKEAKPKDPSPKPPNPSPKEPKTPKNAIKTLPRTTAKSHGVPRMADTMPRTAVGRFCKEQPPSLRGELWLRRNRHIVGEI